MNVSSFYYNEAQEMAVVILKNGNQYSFDANNNFDELDGIVDHFIYKYDDAVVMFSPNESDEIVEDLQNDDWDDITHVYVDLKFVGRNYIPETVR